eukprot:6069629-Pyramimonas_sp.AAC.1
MKAAPAESSKVPVLLGAAADKSNVSRQTTGTVHAEYKFDDGVPGHASTIVDSSGNGRNLQTQGSSWWAQFTTGYSGQAIHFNSPSAGICGSANSWFQGPSIIVSEFQSFLAVEFYMAIIRDNYHHREVVLSLSRRSLLLTGSNNERNLYQGASGKPATVPAQLFQMQEIESNMMIW